MEKTGYLYYTVWNMFAHWVPTTLTQTRPNIIDKINTWQELASKNECIGLPADAGAIVCL